jgi:hypothetical protein
VIVTEVAELTWMVVTVKVAEEDPAATVTLAGVVELALLSESVTTMPPAGAKPVRVTVPVEELPPATGVGLMATEVNAAGFTVSVVVREPFRVAVIVTGVAELTPLVVIENVAEVAPPATVTLAGTVAEGSLLASVTAMPPAGAALPRVTVPVEPLPPTTAVGLTVRFDTVGGLIVSEPLAAPL